MFKIFFTIKILKQQARSKFHFFYERICSQSESPFGLGGLSGHSQGPAQRGLRAGSFLWPGINALTRCSTNCQPGLNTGCAGNLPITHPARTQENSTRGCGTAPSMLGGKAWRRDRESPSSPSIASFSALRKLEQRCAWETNNMRSAGASQRPCELRSLRLGWWAKSMCQLSPLRSRVTLDRPLSSWRVS